MTDAQWFWRGYVDGAVLKTDASYRDAVHRYPDVPVSQVSVYMEGTVDGAKGDSHRLQWVAPNLVSI